MPYQKGQSGNPAGKPKGANSKVTRQKEAQIAASGLTPLEFMLNMLRDPEAAHEDRKWAAQNAAPYAHAKLAAVTLDGNLDVGLHAWLTEAKKARSESD
jgi:Family of unknown function (DUF5681)